jgi:hypothetical protein
LDATALVKGSPESRHLYTQGRELFGSWRSAIQAAGLDYVAVARYPALYTTRSAIRRAIRLRKAKGLGLTTWRLRNSKDFLERSLFRAGCRYFGKWSNAVRAAGFRYVPQAHCYRCRYPDKEAVRKGIRGRYRRKWPLSSKAMPGGPRGDWPLYNSARRFFGSWPAAVEAAGISYQRVSPLGYLKSRPALTAAGVRHAIVGRRAKGHPLNARSLKTPPHADWFLLRSARMRFGSWRNAVQAAGIEYTAVARRYKYAERADVARAIHRRHQGGLSLAANEVRRGEHKEQTLYMAARRLLGSWELAIKAAGFDYDLIARFKIKYPDARAVAEKLRWRAREGWPVHANAVREGRQADPGLYTAGRRCWRTWERALAAARAGCSPAEYRWLRFPARHHVVTEVRRRFKQNGALDPNILCAGNKDDQALWVASVRHFGTWRQVAQAARIPLDMFT